MNRMEKATRFLTEWQKAASLDEFCKATGLKRDHAVRTAISYRQHGVPLKRFPRSGGIDYRKLAEIAKTSKK